MVEGANDPLKGWKDLANEAKGTPFTSNSVGEDGQPIAKKRPFRKLRPIPESYFLARKSLPSAIAFYGSFIVAGVGAGMLLEVWINKKVKEDGGGVVWEFGK